MTNIKGNKMTPAHFLIGLSLLAFGSSVILGVYGMVTGPFTTENWHMMIGMGLYMASVFTLIIGLFSSVLGEKDKT